MCQHEEESTNSADWEAESSGIRQFTLTLHVYLFFLLPLCGFLLMIPKANEALAPVLVGTVGREWPCEADTVRASQRGTLPRLWPFAHRVRCTDRWYRIGKRILRGYC